MSSAILKIASNYLKWIMIVFSVFILFRGHNAPGGGFIGGIIAGSGILFDALANGVDKVHKRLLIKPFKLIGIGLLLCFTAALAGYIFAKAILAGLWTQINLPVIGIIKAGTPLLFDIGIYLVVTGSFLLIIFTIMEELEWK
jgi:multicomponent Na+:H+ antiporter subunit B